VKYIFAVVLLFISSFANSTLLESKNYLNNVNNNYWTNLDLGIDVLRLNWADTLGGSNQADLSDYDSFINNSNNTWRYATWSEFLGLVDWFDTDPNSNGWSEDQNVGGNLFFDLNLFGPAYVDQYGFDHEGYTYWQFGSFNNDNNLEYVWFADFGDQDDRVDCVSWSVLCFSSYFPDANTPMWTADHAISLDGINVAPVLVRDLPVVSSPITWLLLSGLVVFGVSRKKHLSNE
jgi:hypothetical protein